MFLGHVLTSRVNRDRIEEHGSTKIAKEMPDLVSSSDPWFRPVDVQFGPDGALYIADFYNRIIAHVEISLAPPGRDRHSGRIWRLVRRGADGRPALRSRKDVLQLSLADQVNRLGDASLAHRLAVLNYLADRSSPAVIAAVRQAAQAGPANNALKSAALWILERGGVLSHAELAAAAKDRDRLVRTHALRILVERATLTSPERELVLAGLQDSDGFVARAAADALARHPAFENIAPLLALRKRAPEDDTHLVYQARKALRDQVLNAESFEKLRRESLGEADARAIADLCLGVPSSQAAEFLIRFLQKYPAGHEALLDWVRHIARHGAEPGMDALVRSLRTDPAHGLEAQTSLFRAMEQGREQRGLSVGEEMKRWGVELAARLLAKTSPPNPRHQKTAADIAAKLQLQQLEPPLLEIATATSSDIEARTACLRALLTLQASAHLAAAEAFLNNASLPMDRRVEIVQALARLNSPESRQVLLTALRQAPGQFAIPIAVALCGTADGAEALLQAVANGQAPAQLLTERTVKDRLLAVRPQESNRLARLTASIRPDSQRLQKIVGERQAAFLKNPGGATAGAKIFQVNCAVCHSLGGQGGNIGPQLDGIGHRGLERLCEDVLDPNRNVDKIFRYSIVNLKNGDAITGLFRRKEGALLIFADATAKEIVVPKSESAENQRPLSCPRTSPNYWHRRISTT